MHLALCLEEILLNIFGHCYSSCPSAKQDSSHATADLAALARTCRTFKEPALDVLWTELINLSPLARCLPEASHRIYPGHSWYSFSRPLKQAEWDILRSYARRVRSVLDLTRGLNWDSVKALLNPPTPDPMFPNLRILRWEFLRETFPLIHHLAVPSLTSLEINFVFGDVPPFHTFPQSLGDLCPNIRRFRIRMRRPQAGSDDAISLLVRRWTNLQVLYCPHISLDIDSLSHLVRTPSLTSLAFTLSAMILDYITSDSLLFFSNLRDLEVSSQSLDSILGLLSHVRLPRLESLTVNVDNCPSKSSLRSYMIAIQKICTCHSLVSFKLIQKRSLGSINNGLERYQLTLEDMRPCMAFNHLRRMDINTALTVNLTDGDLLELASAWPNLEYLLINEGSGWKTEGGITPNGVLRLLKKLESLHHLCLAIDTRGYTEIPPALGWNQVTPRVPFSVNVNVVDSMIRPESVGALAAFFGGIMQQRVRVFPCYWNTPAMTDRLDSEILKKLWEDVFVKASERVRAHSRSSRTDSKRPSRTNEHGEFGNRDLVMGKVNDPN